MMNLSLELPLDDMFGKLQKDIEDAYRNKENK